MNINELIEEIKELALSHKQVVSFQVGNTFDIATSKSSESYPAVWLELPILASYDDRRKKMFSIALNFLTLVKQDDINDTISKTSDMEVLADEMLHAIDDNFTNIGIDSISGLTLRNFSDDDLVGVRVDLMFTIGRVCDYKQSFNTVI